MLKIHASEPQIHGRLLMRLVHAEKESLRFLSIFCVEALELFGVVVERVEDAFATEE